MTLTWPVVINGRNYAVSPNEAQLTSIQKVRQQADNSREFGESSLNPEDLWRRSQEDWSAGAGREFLDKREDATRRQFFTSAGLDPWTRGELKLTTAAAYFGDLVDVLGLVVADGKIAYVVNDSGDWKVYAIDSATVSDSGLFPETDLYPDTGLYPESGSGTFSLLTTQASEVAIDITSDGFYAYVLHENGVDQIDMDTGTNTEVLTQTGDWVTFTKGRLLVGSGENLYDGSSGTATDITPSTINSNWAWNSACETGRSILVGGFGGERSTIFSVTVTEDAASLTAPVPAATLPYGETIQALYGYASSVVIGTDRGIRVAQEDSSGNLFYGPLVEVGEVTALTAFGKFVYFGGNDDGDLGFVGKMNLGLFTDDLVPAYAIDLFNEDTDRTAQGAETETVPAVVVLGGAVMWLVENHLWYEVPADHAVTGTLTSGKMTYDLAERKVFERVRVACDPIATGQTITVSAVVDGTEHSVATISTVGDAGGEYDLGQTGDHIQVKLTLTRGDDQTASPVVKRVTVRALPKMAPGDRFILPLILRERVADLRGVPASMDPMTEYNALKTLERDSDLVTVTLWGTDYEAVVDAVQFGPGLEYTADQQGLQGVATVALRTFNTLE